MPTGRIETEERRISSLVKPAPLAVSRVQREQPAVGAAD